MSRHRLTLHLPEGATLEAATDALWQLGSWRFPYILQRAADALALEGVESQEVLRQVSPWRYDSGEEEGLYLKRCEVLLCRMRLKEEEGAEVWILPQAGARLLCEVRSDYRDVRGAASWGG